MFLSVAVLLAYTPPDVPLGEVLGRLATLEGSFVVALDDSSVFPPDTLKLSQKKLIEMLEEMGYRMEGNTLISKAWPSSVFSERPMAAARSKEVPLSAVISSDKSWTPPKEFFRSTLVLSKARRLKFHSFYAPFELIVGGKPTSGSQCVGSVLKLIGSRKLSEETTTMAKPDPKIWQPRMLESVKASELGRDVKTLFQLAIPELSSPEIDQLLSNMDAGKRFPLIGKPKTNRYVRRSIDYYLNGPTVRTGLSDEQKSDLVEKVDFTKISIGMSANFTSGAVWFAAKPGGAQLSWMPIPVPNDWGNP